MSSMVTLYTTPEPFDSLCIIVWILAFSLPFFHMFYYYYSLQLFLTISLPPPLCLFLFFPLLLSERRRVEQPLYSLHSPPKEVSMSMSVVCTGNVRRTACVNLFALMVRVSQVKEWIEYCLIGLLYSTTKHREPSICTANLMEITHLVFKIVMDLMMVIKERSGSHQQYLALSSVDHECLKQSLWQFVPQFDI